MRKKKAKKRILLADPKFGSVTVTRFVNNLMLDGKKNTAFKVFYTALDSIAAKIEEEEVLVVFEKALDNVSPHVEVRSRRIGGATFQIPHPVREDRKISLGMKWMITAARKRNEKTMDAKLAAELMAAYKEEGTAYKKKQDTHRMAEANKAFSHFRF
jgi:small subunit ribosomal protein S7